MAEYKKLPDGTIVKVAGQGGIADNLTTLSPVMSLSAKQGNVLDTNKANKTDISSIITTGTKNTTGAQIASGTYFYLNGQLVKAKSNIAVNANYTLNTNYELATVGDVLTKLNSKFVRRNFQVGIGSTSRELDMSSEGITQGTYTIVSIIQSNTNLSVGAVKGYYPISGEPSKWMISFESAISTGVWDGYALFMRR